MRINGNSFDPIRPDRPATSANQDNKQANDSGAVQPNGSGATRSDSVQISAAGRSLAGRTEADAAADFDPERVAELRTKVLTGAYNTLDVVDQVARRILSRGDL